MQLVLDGRTVQIATGGGQPRDDRALVFVHGAGMDHTVWQQQARYLAHRGYAVLAVDLPGHGGSTGPALERIADVADWLAQVIGAAGLERAGIIGHSMGALAALALAARHPERVAALALLGVAGRMPVHPALMAAAAENPAKAAGMIADWGHGLRARKGGNAVPGLWLTGLARRLIERAAPGVLAADLAACHGYADAVPDAGRVHCPTMLLLGAQDRMTPPKAARPLLDVLGEARETLLPGIGHMVMVEAPEAVRMALHRFFEDAMTGSEG